MAERLGNLGYFGLVKETVKGTALTPTDYIPLYDETISTNGNFVDQSPIFGNKFATYAMLQGQRSHKGDVTVLAEPNTTARLLDMLLTRTSTTGAGPYTHTFALAPSPAPNSYTIDVSTGNTVARYFGVEASKISPAWNKNELQWKLSISALGSFQGRALAGTPTGAGPYTVVLDTTYDPNPTTGLVVGDLIRFYKAPGTTIDATVATIVNGTTFTTAAVVTTMSAGDFVYLRPATPSFTLLNSFLWAKTQFQFGATAAAALSAAQTRVEQGSNFAVMHSFESDDGAMRSGGFDPAALVRKTGDIDLGIKRFWDTPDDLVNFNALNKTAAVIRHFAGVTNQYEMRVVYNHLKTDGMVVPDIKSNDIAYSDLKYHPVYDQTDAQGFNLVVVNGLATI